MYLDPLALLLQVFRHSARLGPAPMKTSKMLGSVSEGAVDEECMAEAK